MQKSLGNGAGAGRAGRAGIQPPAHAIEKPQSQLLPLTMRPSLPRAAHYTMAQTQALPEPEPKPSPSPNLNPGLARYHDTGGSPPPSPRP